MPAEGRKSSPEDILVGGQAVIEGVMMRTPHAYAVVVRRADGSLTVKKEAVRRLADLWKPLTWPVVRGFAVLVQSLALGIRTLNFSFNAAMADATPKIGAAEADASPKIGTAEADASPKIGAAEADASPNIGAAEADASPNIGAAEADASPKIGTAEADASPKTDAASPVEPDSGWLPVALSMGAALVFAVAIFILAPLYLTTWLKSYFAAVHNWWVFNLVDGVIRVVFFLAYILIIGNMKDIRRVFQYHGAEHKVVHTWEAREELTVENARRKSTLHPRCGTSFLLFVMVVSIVVFSLFRFHGFWAIFLSRVVLLPFVSGLSYEMIRFSAPRSRKGFFRLVVLPGLNLQRLTTREPGDDQLEAAILALQEALALDSIKAQEAQAAA